MEIMKGISMNTLQLKIDGMTCMGCVANVTRLLKSQTGVHDAIVTLAPGAASVNFDAAAVSETTLRENLKQALEDAGYDTAST
jgi:copper chaperone